MNFERTIQLHGTQKRLTPQEVNVGGLFTEKEGALDDSFERCGPQVEASRLLTIAVKECLQTLRGCGCFLDT